MKEGGGIKNMKERGRRKKKKKDEGGRRNKKDEGERETLVGGVQSSGYLFSTSLINFCIT